ncbi:MAG: hypothetical protein F6K18_32860 [Okeania sp. SIO2C2]|uniref:hypothetical protein n=1 Tax=Okeania sp. SIO2C2 TaxID=2607787 RepID=UPI0013BDA7B5|nr:hypothetical protein [Okeania sp. SIO2C2]NEP91210.1 hypothetical protein [Okeania sp. SIO2C2]
MKKALGKVIVAFFFCLLSFAVVSPSPAMAAEYCFLGQEPQCFRELPFSGDLLYVDIPEFGVSSIDVILTNFSNGNEAVVNSDIDYPIVIAPDDRPVQRNYPVVPRSSVTFSNESPVPDTLVRIRVFGNSR